MFVPRIPTICSLLLLVTAAVHAAVQPKDFSRQELRALAPLLDRFDVVGVYERDDRGRPVAMHAAVAVAATPKTLFTLLRDPKNYYYISTLFKENEKQDGDGRSLLWTWASRHQWITVTGTNLAVFYPPRRIDVQIVRSDVGAASFTLRMYPLTPARTLVTLSGHLDVRTSQWLLRVLIGANPAMHQAMNAAIGYVVLRGIKTLAEQVASGKPPRPHRTKGAVGGPPAALTDSQWRALIPLLDRGQVFLCTSHPGGRLRQATVIDTATAALPVVREQVGRPENYGKYVGAITVGPVTTRKDGARVFPWQIGLPLLGFASQNVVTNRDDGCTIQATDGDLAGAYWRWQLRAVSAGRTAMAYHAFVDVRKLGSILESTVVREPYLEHGLVLGSNFVMVTAMQRAIAAAIR